MSVRVQSEIWRKAPYSEGALLVLLALGDWADDDGWCWPKLPALAAKSRLSERQTYKVLKLLVADGVVQRHSSRGRGKVTRYRVILAALENPTNISGFPPDVARKKPESEIQKPEFRDTKNLNFDALLYGRTVSDPPGTVNTPISPHRASAAGARAAFADSRLCGDSAEPAALAPHVDAVMHACGFSHRRLRRTIAAQMLLATEDGTPAPTVQLRMISQWRQLKENTHKLRYAWGAARFFGEGYWRSDADSWPWNDSPAHTEAAVGMNRTRR